MKLTLHPDANVLQFSGELTTGKSYVCGGVFPGTNHMSRRPELGALIFNDKQQWSMYPLLIFVPEEADAGPRLHRP